MKPRRKLTAIVMAAAMMLTMVPAAYAAESPNVEEPMYVWAHGEQVKVPDQSDVQAALESEPGTNAIDLQSTSNNVYHISSAAELMTIPQSVWISGNTFELDANIDLSSVTPPAEWGGYINFFKGTLDGNGHTISGLENNTYLIYGMIGGTIKDVNLALSGTDAAALAFISASDGQTPI